MAARRRPRKPSLRNNLKFHASLLPPFNPLSEFPMKTSSRRNILIRSVAGLAGDIAIGVAVASACVWAIEAATLGLFLSFLLWLLAAIVSLALSQFVLHPAVNLMLSDQKLDAAVNALAGAGAALDMAGGAAMRYVRSSLSRMRPAATA